MSLRKRFYDFQQRHSSKETQQKPLPDTSPATASNNSLTTDCILPTSQGASLSSASRKNNEISTGLKSSFTAGALPAFAQAIIEAEPRSNSPDKLPLAFPDDLWNRAYERLKAQDEKLIGHFERLLAENAQVSHTPQALASASDLPVNHMGSLDAISDLIVQSLQTEPSGSIVPFTKVGTFQRQDQMKALLNEKIKIDEEAVWKLRVGDNQILIRDQIGKVVKVVAAAKDFVGAALAADPHAALAWTGICTLLPVNCLLLYSFQGT